LTAEDKTAEDKTAEDKTAEDKTAEDKTAEDKTAEDNPASVRHRVFPRKPCHASAPTTCAGHGVSCELSTHKSYKNEQSSRRG